MGLIDKVFGPQNGMMTDPEQQAANQRARLAMMASLFESGGPSPNRISTGQAIGRGVTAFNQSRDESAQSALQNLILKRKLEQEKTPPVEDLVQAIGPDGKPTFVKKSQAAGMTPYDRAASGGVQPTANIQDFEYFQRLTPDQQKIWTAQQRQPTVPQIVTLNGVPTLVDRVNNTVKPLSTIESEAAAKGAVNEAAAVGTARGEAKGAMQKKSINALNVLDTLDLADPLIDVATGSGTGAAADKVASFFGESTTGDQAIAQLKIVQANLMTNMPRMEGPQSDRDVQLYREAAGELGDATVPRARKKAALSMIRALQQKYADGMEQTTTKRKYNPATGKIE